MQESTVFQMAYHLCGVTLLGKTESEPLGTLPYPIRSSVLRIAKALDPTILDLEENSGVLNYHESVANYSTVESWTLRNSYLATVLEQKSFHKKAYNSVQEYFDFHDLNAPQLDNEGQGDEHYAERIFIENVFVKVLGLEALSYLKPQVPFVDSNRKQRRIDFVLVGKDNYALEVEGASFHDTNHMKQERFVDEKTRQAELNLQGFVYFPFAAKSIFEGKPAQRLLSDLCLNDPILLELLNKHESADTSTVNNNIRGNHQQGTDYKALIQLLKDLPNQFQDCQKLALSLIWQACHDGKRELHLLDRTLGNPVFALATLDTLTLLDYVAGLYKLPIKLPEIHFGITGANTQNIYSDVLKDYLNSDSIQEDQRIDKSDIEFSIYTIGQDSDSVDFIFELEPELTLSKEARKHTQLYQSSVGYKPPFGLFANSLERTHLDYFARRYFPYLELQDAQLMLLQRALKGESGLGILPTGFGKSAIFQLFSILTPAVTIVLSPLKALIRDQVYSLQKRGVVAIGSITGDDNAAKKTKVLLDSFQSFQNRMLYISPERIQIKSFRKELKESMENTPITAIVVDEAHCVSEWGHDFRPAYLQISEFKRELEEGSKRKIPIIALTATASPIVRKDIASMLSLSDESVVQLSSSDRPNLSLSVHKVPSDAIHAKTEVIHEVLSEKVPTALKISKDELLPINQDMPYEHAGVIFAVFANPHGKQTLHEGVHAIADKLVKQILYDDELVKVHASSQPEICPNCESPLFITTNKAFLQQHYSKEEAEQLFEERKKNKKQYFCYNCNQVFLKTKYYAGWDKKLRVTQDAFQLNEFPVLVATKGYGMGIDKRNIRYIVHHNLSGGFEGYYQEAGRAGRDNKQAHVALVYSPPTEDCWENHLSKNEPPPCARKGWRGKCDYGLETKCDYFKQANFIEESYPGIDKDVVKLETIYDAMQEDTELEVSGDRDIKNAQFALYRLQQLGVINNYTIEYKSLLKVIFHIQSPEKQTAKDIHDALDKVLEKYNITSATERAKLLKSLEPFLQTGRVRVGEDRYRAAMVKASEIMLKRIYQLVPNMRYLTSCSYTKRCIRT